MVTAKEVTKGTVRGVLSAGIVAARVAKYGLKLVEIPKMMFGGAKDLAEQFAPGGIKTKIGEKMLDTGVKVTNWGLDQAIKMQKYLKGKIH